MKCLWLVPIHFSNHRKLWSSGSGHHDKLFGTKENFRQSCDGSFTVLWNSIAIVLIDVTSCRAVVRLKLLWQVLNFGYITAIFGRIIGFLINNEKSILYDVYYSDIVKEISRATDITCPVYWDHVLILILQGNNGMKSWEKNLQWQIKSN